MHLSPPTVYESYCVQCSFFVQRKANIPNLGILPKYDKGRKIKEPSQVGFLGVKPTRLGFYPFGVAHCACATWTSPLARRNPRRTFPRSQIIYGYLVETFRPYS